ncbi:hypothetical protein PE067_19695 [Paracoccus sp. DMF-8]|uniref:hypothetical protein n=1 Tax=Paracoccus sp. DMF-8 TaxID=3019445 RepID=UPI0023E412F9|nr:hypothetical protein [Paracoccus sp. DMF-8]MDF3608170.1 hypothetical protein [Paracoccus sp. DMF-8]
MTGRSGSSVACPGRVQAPAATQSSHSRLLTRMVMISTGLSMDTTALGASTG